LRERHDGGRRKKSRPVISKVYVSLPGCATAVCRGVHSLQHTATVLKRCCALSASIYANLTVSLTSSRGCFRSRHRHDSDNAPLVPRGNSSLPTHNEDAVLGADVRSIPGFADINHLPYFVALTMEVFRCARRDMATVRWWLYVRTDGRPLHPEDFRIIQMQMTSTSRNS